MLKTSLTAIMKGNPEWDFDVVNGNVRQIALHPARRVAAPAVVDGGGEAACCWSCGERPRDG